MQTIYKKDTTGKIRYLQTWTDGDILHQVTGVVGTSNPVPHQKQCTPKNVGRANETSGEAQALLEMASLIAEKIKGGYFTTQQEAEAGDIILPMLAKSYKDEVKKIDWKKAFVQPKFDGMRALRKTKGLMSREGSEISTVPHILEVLSQLPEFALDGELYAHGETFQENMRLIKKHRPGESEAVKYHVYDVVADLPYDKRNALLREYILDNQKVHQGLIVLAPTIQVYSESELKKIHAKNIEAGYEGSILRHGDAFYKPNGRSSNLLKYKDFLDLACVIKDIEPAKDRPTWAVPVFEYNGKEFRAGMKFSHAEREEMLRNKENYIGKVAELRFFEWTEDGIPRFPVMVGIRLDKKKGD